MTMPADLREPGACTVMSWMVHAQSTRESLLMRKIPLPWDLHNGFMIHYAHAPTVDQSGESPTCESLLMRKMPLPWDLEDGFMIQVVLGALRYS